MKNLFKILFLLSTTTFLFSIGERVDEVKYTINKIDSLSNITGWSKIQGQWKESDNKIPIYDLIKMKEKI